MLANRNSHLPICRAELDIEFSAKHLVYVYSSELGWKFDIYGPPPAGMSDNVRRARASIQVHECITYRPPPGLLEGEEAGLGGDDGAELREYEHEAMVLRILSLL